MSKASAKQIICFNVCPNFIGQHNVFLFYTWLISSKCPDAVKQIYLFGGHHRSLVYSRMAYLSTNTYRRKFRSQTSNNMDRWKHRGDKKHRREEKERRSKKRKSQKKKDAGARKGAKVAIHHVFPMICGARGSKKKAR